MYLSQLLDVPQHRTRVLCKDVGGAFGFKWSIYREDIAIAAASKQLGVPVKWIEDRAENLTAGGSAREETLDVDFAVQHDGTILGIRVRMTMDHGAYPAMPPAPVFAALVRATLLSALRVSVYAFETTIVATNKNPYISYRGPGASETLVRERMMDLVARELGIDPVDVRRINLLTREEQPWRMPSGRPSAGRRRLETLDAVLRALRLPGVRAGAGACAQAGALSRARFLELDPADARVPGLVGIDRVPDGEGPVARSARARRPRHRHHVPDAARPGARDDAGPDRCRRDGSAFRPCHGRSPATRS